MQRIKEDINNNNFKSIYLLYGKENYLKRLYKNKFREAIVGNDDTMNYSYFDGKGIDVNELIEIANTMPFFKDRRLVLIENSGLLKGDKKDISTTLANYIKNIPDTTHIIFIEEDIDKRSRLYKSIVEKGYVTELNGLNEKDLVKWIFLSINKENKKVTEDTILKFIDVVGTDMENIEKELEKLISYTLYNDVITTEDVMEVCTSQVVNKIFDMINAIAEKNQKKALDLYYDLLTLKEPPMRILFLLVRQFNLLLQVKGFSKQGLNSYNISQKIGLHRFIVEKCLTQSRNFSEETLKSALEYCLETETLVKTGRINDIIGVEMIIIKYSI